MKEQKETKVKFYLNGECIGEAKNPSVELPIISGVEDLVTTLLNDASEILSELDDSISFRYTVEGNDTLDKIKRWIALSEQLKERLNEDKI